MNTVRAKSNTPLTEVQKSEALYEAIHNIRVHLNLTTMELAQLIHCPISTVKKWLQSGRVPAAVEGSPTLETIVNLVRIYANLDAMFNNNADSQVWLRSPHENFGGLPPIEHASSSIEGLIYTRQYLDFVRGMGA